MNSNVESILITGATGFIGKNLIRQVAIQNAKMDLTKYKVIAAVRDVDRARNELSGLIDETSIVFLPFENKKAIDFSEQIDWIICAGATTDKGVIGDRPVEVFDENVSGIRNCLEYAKEKRVKGIVFISSSSVHYSYVKSPLNKNLYDEANHFLDAYAVSKATGEFLCNAYYKEYAVPVKIARLFQVYGEGDHERGTFLSECFSAIRFSESIKIMSDGKNVRNLLHVEDAARAILDIMERGCVGEVYNVGSLKNNYTFLDIANAFAEGNESGLQIIVEQKAKGEEDRQVPVVDKIIRLGWREKRGEFKVELKNVLKNVRTTWGGWRKLANKRLLPVHLLEAWV